MKAISPATGIILFLVIRATVNFTSGFELTSALPRFFCFKNVQPKCNIELRDAYPQLSMSYLNVSKADTWFLLYTRRNRHQPELLHKCGGRLPPDTNFNPNRPLIITIPGWNTGYCNVAVFREITAQLLKKGDYNVIAIDLSWGGNVDYALSLQNGKITAQQAIVVLKNIKEQTGISFKQVHIVGHSIGAQIASGIAREIRVGRITGLDAARPGYPPELPIEDRLDPSDADLVDVWHTNAGPCLPNVGIDYDAGHIDYYVNGGTIQLSCYYTLLKAFLKGDVFYAIADLVQVSCFHFQSVFYFMESINPAGCQYAAVKCAKKNPKPWECNSCGKNGELCTFMGFEFGSYYSSSSYPTGRYQVRTGIKCDFCDNRYLGKNLPAFLQ